MALGAPELLIILIIVLVIFGGAKLPKLAKSLGEAQREFKKGNDEDAEDTASGVTGAPTATATATDNANDPKGPVS